MCKILKMILFEMVYLYNYFYVKTFAFEICILFENPMNR